MTRNPKTRNARLRDDQHRVRNTLPEARDQLQRKIHAATGSTAPSLLAQAVTPAIYLHTGQSRPNTRSHQGGFPQGVTRWPMFEGRPQLFLLAICLSEIEAEWRGDLLPPKGWLNFFMAREVMTGEAPLTACAVLFTPRETARQLLLAPRHLPKQRSQMKRLAYSAEIHDLPQAYEFATQGEYETALAELNALQPGYRGHPHLGPQPGDYLLGKQKPSNRLGLEVNRDVAAFMRKRRRRENTKLRALLSLTTYSLSWPVFKGDRVLSVTFFIEEGDLYTRQFDRVIVDVVSL